MDKGRQSEAFLAALQESSKKVRNTATSYLLLALFIWLTVEGVTHEQLLNPEIRISLPVIGVNLPVVGFFVVAPVLFVLSPSYLDRISSWFFCQAAAGSLICTSFSIKDKKVDKGVFP